MKKLILLAVAAFFGITASAQSLKIAHVDFNELVALSPSTDSVRAVITKAQNDFIEEINMMQTEFRNKYEQYQQKAATWTASVRESKERELQEINGRIQDFQQNAQQEIQQLQSTKMAPIYQKANEIVQNLAKQGGYAFVFDVNSALYIDKAQSTDLTPAARKAMGIPEGRTMEDLEAEMQAQAAAQAQQ